MALSSVDSEVGKPEPHCTVEELAYHAAYSNLHIRKLLDNFTSFLWVCGNWHSVRGSVN